MDSLLPEAGTSDNFDWGKPAESQPRSKPDWISEVRWPALVKFQMTEVSASGLDCTWNRSTCIPGICGSHSWMRSC